MTFSYNLAFSRNIGWVTEKEQLKLKKAKIAIAGMGGVGGNHLLTLTRLGIENFNIADFDNFDIVNFNRQVGATMDSLQQSKVDILSTMALSINPDCVIEKFNHGISIENVDQFLSNVDVYVDGLDFFAFDARKLIFTACQNRKIPIITVAPLGFGASLLVFTKDGMPFEDYFGFNTCSSDTELAVRFLTGLTPSFMHRSYLVEESSVNLKEKKGPSSFMACQLCSGIAATEVLKLILQRGIIAAAPYSMQYDAYLQRYSKIWRPLGYRNPLQQLLYKMILTQINKKQGS